MLSHITYVMSCYITYVMLSLLYDMCHVMLQLCVMLCYITHVMRCYITHVTLCLLYNICDVI